MSESKVPVSKAIPTDNDIKAVYEIFAKRAVEIFNEAGHVAPQIFAVMLEEGRTGEVLGVLTIPKEDLNNIFLSPATKNLFKPLVHMFLEDDSPMREDMRAEGHPLPCLVVQVREAWVSEGEAAPATGDTPMPPSQRTDRQEVILVTVHTKDLSHVGCCPIEEKPVRHCEFVPLVIAKPGTHVGRLSMFTQPSQDPKITLH
jgi:hypothetical protein